MRDIGKTWLYLLLRFHTVECVVESAGRWWIGRRYRWRHNRRSRNGIGITVNDGRFRCPFLVFISIFLSIDGYDTGAAEWTSLFLLVVGQIAVRWSDGECAEIGGRSGRSAVQRRSTAPLEARRTDVVDTGIERHVVDG